MKSLRFRIADDGYKSVITVTTAFNSRERHHCGIKLQEVGVQTIRRLQKAINIKHTSTRQLSSTYVLIHVIFT